MSTFMNQLLSLSRAVLGQAEAGSGAETAAPNGSAAPSSLPTTVDPAAAASAAGNGAAAPVSGAGDAAQAVGAAASNASEAASSAVSGAGDALQSAGSAVSGAADSLASTAASASDSVGAAAHAAAGAVPPIDPEAAAQSMGFLHFIAQSDYVGKGLFIILLIMSLVSWYLILVKTFSNARTRRRSATFLNRFWNSSSLEQVENETATHGVDPFSHLTVHALEARRHHQRYGATNLEAAGSNSDFIMRSMRKVIDEETAKLENGLTVLASVGSTAPFVGLFGTVWGVYHALVGIGLADGVTINRIAGPVGEALIMTGLGLAVAIPAVLAYNAFVRGNRVLLSRLDAFAHDLFAFLTTGQQLQMSEGKARAMRRQSHQAAKGSA